MSFTYDLVNAYDLSVVRLLVFDTNSAAPIFEDIEVTTALQYESSQNLIVALSGYTLRQPAKLIYSHRRAAAMLLRSLAANKARLATISGLLDVKLNAAQAAQQLNALADQYINDEANAGYFAISEMVVNNFSMRERLVAMLYRFTN